MQPANFSQVVPGIVNASTPISGFNISAFAAQSGLGSPVAGNFFFTGPDNTTAATTTTTIAGTAAGSSVAAGTAMSPSTATPSSPSAGAASSAPMTVDMGKLSAIGVALVVGLLGILAL